MSPTFFAQCGTAAPRRPAAATAELAAVGALRGRARLGHGARGLQRERRRLGLFRARPGALARLPLERGRPRGHLRRGAAAVFRARAVERQGPDAEGARVRPHGQRGQPRRGRQGVLLLPRRHAEPQLPALPLQVSAGAVSVRGAGRGERAPLAGRAGVHAAGHRRLRREPLLGCRGAATRRPRRTRFTSGSSPPIAGPRPPRCTCCPRSGSATRGPGARRARGRGWPRSSRGAARAGRCARTIGAWARTFSTGRARPRRCSPRTTAMRNGCGAPPMRRPG